DFPATSAVPLSVLNDVETRVNELLISDLQVHAEVMSQSQAKAMGAMALFGEKYGDEVRVVSVGDWAKELCGGTHVARSGELGVVKLLSESSIGAGVRRVEALVGFDAYKYLAREHLLLNSLTEIIKGARAEELPQRISELMEKMKSIEKELSTVRIAGAIAGNAQLIENAKNIGAVKFVAATLDKGLTADELRSIALDIRGKLANSVIVLSSITDEKVVLVAATSDDAIKMGIKAGELVKLGSTVLGGGGGGKDDFAQGGGSQIDKIKTTFEEIEKILSTKLK
ncbi:MAG: alanine--tRNA ligase, partial [Actinobacteria bacterium]|nr:alanine--tRNA ligase [Actinomycetota bacterium]